DAYVPAPIIGESPTRPGILPCKPPVEVPAAILPLRSSATTPTLPYKCESTDSSSCATGTTLPSAGTPTGRGGIGFPSFVSCFTSDCQRLSVKKKLGGSCSSPLRPPKSSAPCPTIIT